MFSQTANTADQRYQDVYQQVLEMVLEINTLKNLHNITKIGFLIDSSISNRHNIQFGPDTDFIDNGNYIFIFQLILVQLITLAVNGQKNYFVQFDEESAW